MLQRRSDSRDSFDVVVVGARCAGSPLATLLARRGLEVCLVDRDDFPSDTPSTHGIQPTGVQVLERLGVVDRLLELAPPIEEGFLAFDEHRVRVPNTASIVGSPMLNLRRITLDAVLLEVAREAGAEVRTKSAVTEVLVSNGRAAGVETTKGPIRARLVVGADGARSTMARLLGAEEYHRTEAHRIFLWSYYEGVDPQEQRVWLGGIGEDNFLASPTDAGLFLAAYVAPIRRRDEVRVDRTAAFEDGVTRWPELGETLAPARRAAPVQLMSNWHGFFRRSAGPGWALVGDAGHFKDPTPGQGIADALRQVEALAPAIEGSLSGPTPADEPLLEWWDWRDRDAWDMYWFAQDLGDTARAPRMIAASQERFASDPEVIEKLLRILNHEVPPSNLFTPRFVLSVLGGALRDGRGERRALLSEARSLGREEFRRYRLKRRRPQLTTRPITNTAPAPSPKTQVR
jgi:2-polyprenyl-6-methoxyphenol hydroxylase-like FAD-dependent oxidoreductase